VLNGIKYLAKKYLHQITIVAFKYKYDSPEYLKKYCEKIVTVDIPSSKKKKIIHYAYMYIHRIINRNISRRDFFDFTYSEEMFKKINDLVNTEKFDIIFIAEPTLCSYVIDLHIPKILETWTASLGYREAYKREKVPLKKFYYYLSYLMMRSYEKEYGKFDVCMVPTENEKSILNSYIPDLNIAVIPFGVDITEFLGDMGKDFPSLLFLGSLNSIFNQQDFFYLYNDIYSVVKNKFPNLRLYVVGKEPPDNITQLPLHDSSLIVTGYVKDIRPFLAKSSVVTLPVHGFGIKTRILEAMAMGKPVVTSSEGVHGIDITPGENILIANSTEEFVTQIIELLNNEELRIEIGLNAKELMKNDYSWEKMTDSLNEIFKEAAKNGKEVHAQK
jgi:glycosyltransferase involved in cell wall biosynthesis